MINSQLDFGLKVGNNDKYKVESIWDNAVYAKVLTIGQLSKLYYFVLWKGYFKKENIWKLALTI